MKEHTVVKVRQLLQEAVTSLSELKNLSSYLSEKMGAEWGSLYLADKGYFALLQKKTSKAIGDIELHLKARGFSFKMISGREALDIVRKVSISQTTKIDRRILQTLHSRAADGALYKITRRGI
jgi:hypothetical protein